jgi:uncharacterized protein (DUF2062 family)
MSNGRLKKAWEKLKKEALSRRSPHEVALGVGVGSFIGILPIQGLKTALVVLIGTFYKRINLISVVASSSVPSFPLVVPFVYFFDYWLGAKILMMPLVFTLESFKGFSFEMLFEMLGSSIVALFVGGLFVGLAAGIFSYFISLSVLKWKHARQV